MYRQWEKLADGVAMTLNSTYTLDLLQRTGYLAALWLEFSGGQVSPLGLAGGKWRMIDYLDNIEVRLNQNPTGFAMNGRLAQAVAGYRLGQLPYGNWRNYASNTQRDVIPILFGTSAWDTRRYLDLSRWNAVQLRIQNSATASQFSDFSVTVYALWLRENQVASQGYVRRELFREYAPTAGSTDPQYLPVEYPLLGVYVQGDPGLDANGRVNTSPQNLLYNVRFSLKSRQIDLYNDQVAHLMHYSPALFDYLGIAGGINYLNNGKEHDVGIMHVDQFLATAGSKTGLAATVIPTYEGDENNPTQNQLGFQADVLNPWLARGKGYHNLMPLWMDKTPDLSEMIDPKSNEQVTVDILTRSTATVTSAFVRTVLERLVP